MDVGPSGSSTEDREERVAVAIAITLGLLLIPALFFLFRDESDSASWNFGALWEPADGEPVLPVAPTAADVFPPGPAPVVPPVPAPELPAEQKALIARLELDNANLRTRLDAQSRLLAETRSAADLADLEVEIESLKGLVARRDSEAKQSEARANALGADLASVRGELETLRGDRERFAAAEANLKKQIADQTAALTAAKAEQTKLQAQLTESRAAMGADVAQLDAKVRQLSEEAQVLQTRIVTVEKERDAAKADLAKLAMPPQPGATMSAGTAAATATETELKRLRDSLAQSEAALKQATDLAKRREEELGAMAKATPSADLRGQLSAAQERVRKLEAQLAARPGAPVDTRVEAFRRNTDWTRYPSEARRPVDLWPGAMPLFQALQMSASAEESVEARDQHVRANGIGELVARVYFADGRSELSADARQVLEEAMAAVPEGSYLLVVGYASVRGRADSNERLSSRRASRVLYHLRPRSEGGKLQMVYFGATNQFDPVDEAKNRVVEVWRVGG